MHEFSIAVNIVEIAETHAREAGADKVIDICIDVGTQSGVVINALTIAMESAMKDTILENAKVFINEIQAEARCLECNTQFAPEDLFSSCPKCSSFQTEITQGKDLKVQSISVE